MKQDKNITVSTVIKAPIKEVWEKWTKPEHITEWNFASDDWHTAKATNDLRKGGRFSATMAAKDGSASFDFNGEYTNVEKHKRIEYTIADGRKVSVIFDEGKDGVKVTETFEMENENPKEMQREGWQAILNNFKKYVENEK
jgi:uncharacterized protein YndB with AHSA1/START domain